MKKSYFIHDFSEDRIHNEVDSPSHYLSHPSGVECIEITEHMDFLLGNAIKYIWRAGLKTNSDTTTDLNKAIWYIERKLDLIRRGQDE